LAEPLGVVKFLGISAVYSTSTAVVAAVATWAGSGLAARAWEEWLKRKKKKEEEKRKTTELSQAASISIDSELQPLWDKEKNKASGKELKV